MVIFILQFKKKIGNSPSSHHKHTIEEKEEQNFSIKLKYLKNRQSADTVVVEQQEIEKKIEENERCLYICLCEFSLLRQMTDSEFDGLDRNKRRKKRKTTNNFEL